MEKPQHTQTIIPKSVSYIVCPFLMHKQEKIKLNGESAEKHVLLILFDSVSRVAQYTVLVRLVTIAPESIIHFFYTGYIHTVGTYDS